MYDSFQCKVNCSVAGTAIEIDRLVAVELEMVVLSGVLLRTAGLVLTKSRQVKRSFVKTQVATDLHYPRVDPAAG